MVHAIAGASLGFFITATALSAASVIGLPLLAITIPGIVFSGIALLTPIP